MILVFKQHVLVACIVHIEALCLLTRITCLSYTTGQCTLIHNEYIIFCRFEVFNKEQSLVLLCHLRSSKRVSVIAHL